MNVLEASVLLAVAKALVMGVVAFVGVLAFIGILVFIRQKHEEENTRKWKKSR